MSVLTDFIGDRIQLNSVLIVACFVSVLLMGSQSAASYPTYLLALSLILSVPQWSDVFQERMSWLLLALLVYLCLTSLWSEPFLWRDAASTATRTLLVFCFVVALAECQLRGQVRRWLGRALALSGVIAVAAALWVYVSDIPADGRLKGLGQLDTEVIAALVFGVCMIFALDLIVGQRSRLAQLMLLASVLMIGVAVYLSDSRNAWVSVVTGAGVFLVAHRARTPRAFMAAMAVGGLCLLGILLLLLLGEGTRDLLLPRGDSFRPDIWREAWVRIAPHGLWFGLGINTSDNFVIVDLEFLHPHSMYLSVLYQGGAIALLLFLTLIIVVLRTLLVHFRHPDAKLALGILFVALPAYLLDGHELIDKVGSTWFLFWLPVAVALGLRWSHPRQDL
ncbi:MAG: O-antigen ligase family protein [Pseudomonadales bacterium]